MAAEARTRVEAGPMIIVATACPMLHASDAQNRPPCDATGRSPPGNGHGQIQQPRGGNPLPFERALTDNGVNSATGSEETQVARTAYEPRDPWVAQQEERERTNTLRVGPNPMSVVSGVSPSKPLRVYPFGVGRNRLEAAIKNLRIPATIVREMGELWTLC